MSKVLWGPMLSVGHPWVGLSSRKHKDYTTGPLIELPLWRLTHRGHVEGLGMGPMDVPPWTDKVGGIVAAQVCIQVGAIRFAQRGLESGTQRSPKRS
jgi:hypothetical protein